MALPTTRSEFSEYCLRSLGKPVIDINVSTEQINDRIDDALQYYQDYHFSGTHLLYVKHKITAADKTNKYVTVSDSIIGINDVFDIGDSFSTNNLFNLRYQISMNEMFDLSSARLSNYTMAMTHIAMLEELLVGKVLYRYNRNDNKLHLDTNWDTLLEGQYIVYAAYEIMDPDTFTDVWKDRWLIRYATQLLKKQWGGNLSKYGNLQLPGGVTMDGKLIYQEAVDEIEKLEADMILSYSLPVGDLVG